MYNIFFLILYFYCKKKNLKKNVYISRPVQQHRVIDWYISLIFLYTIYKLIVSLMILFSYISFFVEQKKES